MLEHQRKEIARSEARRKRLGILKMSIGVGGTRTRLLFTVTVAIGVIAAASSPAWAQRLCVPTQNNCPSADVTTRTLQMGGQGSLSSNGSAFSHPGRLDDGTIAEADFVFSYNRTTGVLTLQVFNRTTTTASLTGLSFNTPPGVTGMTLVSETGSLVWERAFDSDRLDNVVDSHPSPSMKNLKMDGMGAYNVLIANQGVSTGPGGGDPIEILAGQNVTFTLQVSGNIGSYTACSFTSLPSVIPPGDKVMIAVARFQAGVQGGSGFITPCGPGDLLVSLSSFSVEPEDGRVMVQWETSSEIDNAGFAILRKEARSGRFERVTPALLPGLGSDVSGASYSFEDTTAVNGVKYHYMLEDFDLGGFNTIHRPERAVPNPQAPPLRLVQPAYDTKAGRVVTLKWQSDRPLPARILISADPTFPQGSTMELAAGAGRTRRLNTRERAQLHLMARAGEGGVYWRVTGRSPQGQALNSQTWFLAVED